MKGNRMICSGTAIARYLDSPMLTSSGNCRNCSSCYQYDRCGICASVRQPECGRASGRRVACPHFLFWSWAV